MSLRGASATKSDCPATACRVCGADKTDELFGFNSPRPLLAGGDLLEGDAMPKVDYGDGLTVNYTDGEYERLQEIRKNKDPGRNKPKPKSLNDRHSTISVSLPLWLQEVLNKHAAKIGEGLSEYIQDAILRKAIEDYNDEEST